MVVIFGLTLLGAIGVLTLAARPGGLEVALFGPLFFFLFWLPLLAIWIVLLTILAVRDLARKPSADKRRRWGLLSALLMFGTFGLIWWHVPQRVVFAFWHPEFTKVLNSNVENDSPGGEINRQIGPYRVECHRTDERGGIYFRTHSMPDGISPDTMSYGFAYRPNREGTPFGSAYYQLHHLFGDWYEFSVSDD